MPRTNPRYAEVARPLEGVSYTCSTRGVTDGRTLKPDPDTLHLSTKGCGNGYAVRVQQGSPSASTFLTFEDVEQLRDDLAALADAQRSRA